MALRSFCLPACTWSESKPCASAQSRSFFTDVLPPAPWSGVPVPFARPARPIRWASAESISARSTLPSARAAARLSRVTACSTISFSLAGFPHQRGLRVRTTSFFAVSTFLTLKGPAVTVSLRRAPSLKASGVPMTSFGYSGENSDFQSA